MRVEFHLLCVHNVAGIVQALAWDNEVRCMQRKGRAVEMPLVR